ncbi:MAG: hypothetical protein AB2A00_18450 [Myxococcota bacterium]
MSRHAQGCLTVAAVLLVSGCRAVICQFPALENRFICVGTCLPVPLEDGHFRITLVDEQKEPVPGAVISVEKGCFYCPGHNNYELGGISNENGEVRLKLESGEVLGIHSFQDGYLYGSASCDSDKFGAATITMKRNENNTPPTISNVHAEPSTVPAGRTFKLRLDLRASSASENSDETLWVQPETFRSGRLKPTTGHPDSPPGDNFPDGAYEAEVTAPTTPGDYDYYLQATAHNCETSPRAVVRVTVTP